MTKRSTILLAINLAPRGLTQEQAAAYVGLSVTSFRIKVAAGVYPAATLAGHRWDRALLDQAADTQSQIAQSQNPPPPAAPGPDPFLAALS